jgi:ketosteroid isomerase-like protein
VLIFKYIKNKMMILNVNRIILFIVAGIALAPWNVFRSFGNLTRSIRPTIENALAADQELAKALQNNDTAGIVRLLDKDWAVITTHGGVAEGPGIFPSGIRTGFRTLEIMDLSEPRVRLFGDVALVTTKVRLAGMFGGKHFDTNERQTDVWRWKDGHWKCILTQESMLGD